MPVWVDRVLAAVQEPLNWMAERAVGPVFLRLVHRRPGRLTAQRFEALAQQALEEGRLVGARGCGAIAVRADPSYAPGYEVWGDACVALGKTDEARAIYKRGLGATPASEHYNLLIGLANLEFREKQYVEAEEAYRRALWLRPGAAHLLGHIALAMKRQGRTDEAEPLFLEEIAALNEADPFHYAIGAHAEVLMIRIEQKRWAEALVMAEELVKLQPEEATHYMNLGGCLRNLGRTEEALAAYRRGVELAPGYEPFKSRLHAFEQQIQAAQERGGSGA